MQVEDRARPRVPAVLPVGEHDADPAALALRPCADRDGHRVEIEGRGNFEIESGSQPACELLAILPALQLERLEDAQRPGQVTLAESAPAL
jgi:hypothetical protein